MRQNGTLRSWSDDRGYGFIAPSHGGAELFCHISALPRDGSRPTIGEKLSYELGRSKDGRPCAVKVMRLAVGHPPPVHRRREAAPRPRWRLAVLAVLVGATAYGVYHQRKGHTPARLLAPADAHQQRSEPGGDVQRFRCDGRTRCSQMSSCAEATWVLNHCPDTQMDGNHDGVPCEQQWCTSPGAR